MGSVPSQATFCWTHPWGMLTLALTFPLTFPLVLPLMHPFLALPAFQIFQASKLHERHLPVVCVASEHPAHCQARLPQLSCFGNWALFAAEHLCALPDLKHVFNRLRRVPPATTERAILQAANSACTGPARTLFVCKTRCLCTKRFLCKTAQDGFDAQIWFL